MVGERISQRYELAARLGSGGTASVWRAKDTTNGDAVAVKLLHVDAADNPEVLARFEREARLLAAIDHPNVVALRDRGSHDDRPFLVFDLVEGESLRERLRRSGPLPLLEATAIAEQLANGLAAAHAARLVHRDLKPANVLIAPDGHVKLADFGIARALEEPGITQPGRVLGTGEYVSPEQALGRPLDARSDLYALGVVLFEMLAGRPPFRGTGFADVAARHVRTAPPSLADVRPEAPRALVALVASLLAKTPDGRPGSAVIARDQLRTVMREVALAEPDIEPSEIVDTALLTTDDAPAVADDDQSEPAPTPQPPTPATRDDATGEVEVAAVVRAAFTLPGAMSDDLAPWEDLTPPSMDFPHLAEELQRRSSGRSRERSIARVVAVVALLAASLGIALVVRTASTPDPVTSGGIETSHTTGPFIPVPTVVSTAVSTGTTTAADIPLAGVQTFDPRPGGDGAENDDQARNAIDGDPTGTWWETEIYHGGSDLTTGKGGVGLIVELTDPASLAAVELRTPIPGFTATLYTATTTDPPALLSGWHVASAATVVSKKRQRLKVRSSGNGVHYVLVWITKLATTSGGYSARLSDVRPIGT